MVTLSGRQTLSSIDQGLRLVHDQIKDIDEQIRGGSAGLAALQEQQAERYKRMAVIRLDQVISGELSSEIDTAGRRVRELLERRSQAESRLTGNIDEAFTELKVMQTERERLELQVEQATGALDQVEGEVQQRLAQDGAYMAQLESAREAERIAEHAEEKTRRAEASRRDKGRPYEDDPLFAYLWARGYGTSKYSANPLIRYLDNWVAGLCNYHGARPNYAMLLEIPKRLEAHAQRARSTADTEFDRLKDLEESVAAAEGVPALRQKVDQAQSGLDEADLGIETAENKVREMEQTRTLYAGGEDEYLKEAVEVLSKAYEREQLQTLYDYARATATAEDDLLAQELEAGANKGAALRESLAEHKRVRERHLDRLQKLEDVRRQFKRQRYDNTHSEFSNAKLVAMILSQFLRGTATSDELWQTIEREQRYRRGRANPDFGSGGFGRRRGTWHIPFPTGGGAGRGRWGGTGGSGGGGMGGGGGFRTGGGF